MKLSDFFHDYEMWCRHCGCLPDYGMDRRLLTVLDLARREAKQPIYVTSGYRCTTHNSAVGGAKESYHMRGMAADVFCEGLAPKDLAEIIRAVMIRSNLSGGLQAYGENGFVHVDCRGYWATWC